MNNKQFEEVLKAILARKYSWACVLVLRFHGYEPSEYMPYRTYIRLLKDNYQNSHKTHQQCQDRKENVKLTSS
ncbi:MAG: HetP family heterocyst commitment protein [Calothrix sp. MO_192.B10]|nr:HetP family heterocyst commitment protein [Calothrix sp. MO_192.B10]